MDLFRVWVACVQGCGVVPVVLEESRFERESIFELAGRCPSCGLSSWRRARAGEVALAELKEERKRRGRA